MIPVESLAQVQNLVSRLKAGAGQFSTNLYAGPGQLESWIHGRALVLSEWPGAALLARRDRDFHHLYHMAANPQALEAALGEGLAQIPGLAVVDLIGLPDALPILAAPYVAHGLVSHQTLVRMKLVDCTSRSQAQADPTVEFADPSQAAALLAFLDGLLDPLAEQVPELLELEAWCRAKAVLVVRREAAILGLLIFEATGLSAVLRYWFVTPEARHSGVGAKLLRTFFALCHDSRRMTLWVISDNHASIAKYEHYGFRREAITDQILVRRPR